MYGSYISKNNIQNKNYKYKLDFFLSLPKTSMPLYTQTRGIYIALWLLQNYENLKNPYTESLTGDWHVKKTEWKISVQVPEFSSTGL